MPSEFEMPVSLTVPLSSSLQPGSTRWAGFIQDIQVCLSGLLKILTRGIKDVKVQIRFLENWSFIMISQTIEYALRAIVTIAQHEGEPCTAQKIAEISKVESEPKMEGRQMMMVVAPAR